MDMDAVVDYLQQTFENVNTTEDSGSCFFSYRPDPGIQLEGWQPFATLVVSDLYDQASQLNRPDVFRLNIGVSTATYRSLFGKPPVALKEGGVVNTGHDFTVLDRIMPHPIYAAMSWVYVLNPSEETFKIVQPLLEEAYEKAVRRYETRSKRSQGAAIP